MSRIGRLPITIPEAVTVTLDKKTVTVTGPKGTLTYTLPPKIEAKIDNGQITLTRLSEDKQTRSNHGSARSHLQI